METIEFKVPFAYDINKIEVYPDKAQKGQKYYCPDCDGELVFRSGLIKRPHFAHKYDPKYCDFHYCPETENHLRAKWKVRDIINKNEKLQITRICSKCENNFSQTIPTDGLRASLEYILNSGLRADVALLDKDDKVKAIIEIKETHGIQEEKKKILKHIPMSEFLAIDVLANDIWEPIYHNFKPVICKDCKARFNKAIQAIADTINKRNRIYVFRKECMSCAKRYKQLIPLKNKKAITHYELSDKINVDIAIVDENNNLQAVILLNKVTEDQKILLKSVPWISLSSETFFTQKELSADCDNFKPSKCDHCRYVHKEYNFTGKYKNSVFCPSSRSYLNVINNCIKCKYFVDIDQNSVICIGAKKGNA